MSIYATSDLHLGLSPRGDHAAAELAAYLNRVGKPSDVLLILGDFGDVNAGLGLFHEFRGTKFAVAGNHDIWVKDGDSLELHAQLGRIFNQHGFGALEEAPAVVDGVGFAGAMGWYDLSFADKIGMSKASYQQKMYPDGTIWQDAMGVQWSMNDQQATEWQLERLRGQLAQLRQLGVKKIVVGMHHVPTNQLLFHPRCLVPRKWRFFNAFLGSQRFGDLLTANGVETAICGHIHVGSNANTGGVRYAAIGSTNHKKELVILSEGGRVMRRSF